MTDLETACDKLGISATVIGSVPVPDGWPPMTRGSKVRLQFGKRRLTVRFFQGPAICRDPSAADVLHCIMSDARSGEMTHDEFCGEFGYDPDSRKSHAIWRSCRKMAPKVRRFLGDHFETLEYCDH